MAASLADATAALNDFKRTVADATHRAYTLIEFFDTIDLNSPSALNEVTSINADWRSFAAEVNPLIKSSNELAVEVANAMEEGPDKKAAAASYKTEVKVLSDLMKTLVVTRDRMRATQADLEKAKTTEPAGSQSTPASDGSTTPATGQTTTEPPASTSDDASQSGSPVFPGNNPAVPDTTNQSYEARARPNPLSSLSSYTYAISLYMVTPEIMNTFVNSGGSMKNIDLNGPGLFVVAQSGGVNNSTERRIRNTTNQLKSENEATGLDYYLDDLSIDMVLSGSENTKSAISTKLSFKITEPSGFSFLQDLNKATIALNTESAMLKESSRGIANGFAQKFILGIRFYGYKEDGSLVSSDESVYSEYENGITDKNAIINRFILISITAAKFKLEGKIVTYECDATPLAEQVSYSKLRAVIDGTPTIVGSTVGDVLSSSSASGKKGSIGLMQVLNEQESAKRDRGQAGDATIYEVQFLNDEGKDDPNGVIASSKLLDDSAFVSSVLPMARVGSTNEVDIAKQFNATSMDTTTKSMSITKGQNIVTVIDNIIVKSSYVSDALREVNGQSEETDTKDNAPTRDLKWYSINPVVTILGRDTIRNDWTYKITYQIKPYDVPYLPSVYVDRTTKYPGPLKFYNYWLTGKNSEITRYTQEYDNLFYSTAALSTTPSGTTGNKQQGDKSLHVTTATGGDQSSGAQSRGSDINEHVRAQLYGTDNMTAKIEILGDPDYIITAPGVQQRNMTRLGSSKLLSGDGSISPFNGQVFIQIVFNTATDYLGNGILDVSSDLQFYQTDRVRKAGINGLVYRVTGITSVFSKGSFKQTLDCLMVNENSLLTNSISTDGNAKTEPTGPGGRERVPVPVSQSQGRYSAAAENQNLASRYPDPAEDSRAPTIPSVSMMNIADGDRFVSYPGSSIPTLRVISPSVNDDQ